MSMPTTKRFPRTLAEAFPHAYPWAITHYKRPMRDAVPVAVTLLACVAIGAMLAWGF